MKIKVSLSMNETIKHKGQRLAKLNGDSFSRWTEMLIQAAVESYQKTHQKVLR